LTHGCLEEQSAMPILVDLRRFHGLQQDLFRFRNAIFFSVNVGQDTAGLATNVHDGGQVLAQEPLKQKIKRLYWISLTGKSFALETKIV